MLHKIFARSSSAPDVMETHRLPAEEGQSRDFVSYLAVRAWHGLSWNVHFCNYLPADSVQRRAKESEMAPGIFPLQTAFDKVVDFRRIPERSAVVKGLSQRQALEFLRDKEAGIYRGDGFVARKGIVPHKDHYSHYMTCPGHNL